MSARRRFTGEFKAKVALEALRGDKTIQEIATRHKVHPNQVSAWKQPAVEGMKEVFSKGAERSRGDHEGEIRDLHAKIGGVDGGAGFFGQRAQVVSRERRRAMIRRDHPRLSLSRQCRLLSVSRSSLYHRPKGENAQNLGLMRRIDELFLAYPFYGSRQMVRHLWREGICVGRHRVRRLMQLMGLQAIYQAPRTTTQHPEHRVCPYSLKGLAIERPNQVWSADITYIPVQRGFLYLVAIMDWATRRVLSWRLSWMPGSASRPWLKPWTATAGPRSSIPTRAANSPAPSSPPCSKTPASPSPWTAGAAAWTTSSSSASGAR